MNEIWAHQHKSQHFSSRCSERTWLRMRALMVTQAAVSASHQGLWRGQHALGLCWEQESRSLGEGAIGDT